LQIAGLQISWSRQRASAAVGVTLLLLGAVAAAQAPPAVTRHASLRGGLRLEYVEQGDRNGLPVVLLHGYTDSWHSYERVPPYLPRNLRVFAISQRGHGDSDRPADVTAPMTSPAT
jgi:pimeloyl-ACP methyl ester carboxylesterase